MNLDLRWPLGWLFMLLGAILVVQGLAVGTRVLGFNVNLVWGAVMVVCGAIALFLARGQTSR